MQVPPIIEVIPYREEWPKSYEAEADKIKSALGRNFVAIHHIGSTAVPGLDAKPIIDILVVVKDIFDIDMKALGYVAKGEQGLPFRRFFHKGVTLDTHSLHVYEEGSSEIERHLHFRDYLRTHPEEAKKFAAIKRALFKHNPQDIEAYLNGKVNFFQKIDQEWGKTHLHLVQPFTAEEWEWVQKFHRKKPKKESIYMLLAEGPDFVGSAQIARDPPLIVELILDPAHDSSRPSFLTLLERWLSYQRVTRLDTL